MQENSTIKKNILDFIDYKGITKYKFYKETGITRGVLDQPNGMSEENTSRFLARYPEVNSWWLITGDGKMLKEEDLTSQIAIKEETRPRVPVDASAGFLSVVSDGVRVEDMEQIPLIKTFPKYDFTIFARGDSMEPEFYSGDELACLLIKESTFIQWGRVHVLDTSQGVVVKRIYNNSDTMVCKSYNAEDYPPFEIRKDEIYNIALVVGCLRRC